MDEEEIIIYLEKVVEELATNAGKTRMEIIALIQEFADNWLL